jgi:hypothetical protein
VLDCTLSAEEEEACGSFLCTADVAVEARRLYGKLSCTLPLCPRKVRARPCRQVNARAQRPGRLRATRTLRKP